MNTSTRKESSPMPRRSGFINLTALLVILSIFLSPLSAFACPTCGCSELCPVSCYADAESFGQKESLLSNSIWGNMILKMAYQHDPQLKRLAKRLRASNLCSTLGLADVATGTMAQGIVAIGTLNPAPGLEDSYTPGAIGVVLEGVTMVIFGGGTIFNASVRHQVKARQKLIREEVEVILHHLEYSESKCETAQKDLAQLIGDRGATECLGLWQSSHVTAEILPK